MISVNLHGRSGNTNRFVAVVLRYVFAHVPLKYCGREDIVKFTCHTPSDRMTTTLPENEVGMSSVLERRPKLIPLQEVVMNGCRSL